ncbi:MAG: hypothetical protein ACKPB7_35790 [Sphaerospermopsis kisseleviana]
MIALDQWINSENPILYGAVTTGEDWLFAIYKRQEKEIIEDLKLYPVPEELNDLVRILVPIVNHRNVECRYKSLHIQL